MALQSAANTVKALVLASQRYGFSYPEDTLDRLQHVRARVAAEHRLPLNRIVGWEDDISAFDKNVRAVHQAALIHHVYRLAMTETELELYRAAIVMDVLSAPAHIGAAGVLYTRPHGGETTSGLIFTTMDGMLINAGRIETCMLSLHPDWELGRHWDYICFGDDTLIVAPDTFKAERFAEESAKLGLPSKIRQGSAFLMRFMDMDRNRWYPMAGRVYQRTVGGEHPPRSNALEALGLFVRTANMDLNPHGPRIWGLLAEGPSWYSRARITSRASLWTHLQTPDVRTELAEQMLSRPNIATEALRGGGWAVDPETEAFVSKLLGRPPPDEERVD